MAGLFGGGDTTTRTQTLLSPQQNALMNLALPRARRYARMNTNMPSRNLVADWDPAQREAQEMALTAAKGGVQEAADAGWGAQKFLMDKAILDPNTNPYLAKTIDAAVRPITQSLTETELPQLRSGAAGAGQYGGSRQGLAEGLASGRASQAVGDTSAKIANANYQAGLDTMTKALGLLPQTQQAMLAPSTITGSVGDARQQLVQQRMNANLARMMYNRGQPLAKAQNLVGLASGSPGGGASSSTSGGGTGLFQGLLGGASLGNSLFPGMLGTAGGAGIGALLSMFDD